MVRDGQGAAERVDRGTLHHIAGVAACIFALPEDGNARDPVFEPLHYRFLLLDEVSASRKEVGFILVCWICECGLADQAEQRLFVSVLRGVCYRSRTLAPTAETAGFVERVGRCLLYTSRCV